MTPADVGHEFARWGPFLLVIAWAAMASILRRRPPRPVEPPAPPRVVQRPPSVPPPIAAAYELVTRPRPAPEPPPVPASVLPELPPPGQLEAQPSPGVPAIAWRQAVVVTEVLGPPVALRRSGTLGPPGAF